MYTITKIETQQKDPTRSSVFINDVFEFGAATKAIERYGLEKGMVLTQEAYESLMARLQLDKAKYRALSYIAGQSKTEKQVREKLTQNEYSPHIVEEVIAFLKQYRYIDDMEFAKRYVESKTKYGRKSVRYIQSQLYMKGICSIDLYEICEGLEEVEEENICYFLKKYGYYSTLPYEKKHKLISRMMNKGFSYEIIQKSMGNLDESFEV